MKDRGRGQEDGARLRWTWRLPLQAVQVWTSLCPSGITWWFQSSIFQIAQIICAAFNLLCCGHATWYILSLMSTSIPLHLCVIVGLCVTESHRTSRMTPALSRWKVIRLKHSTRPVQWNCERLIIACLLRAFLCTHTYIIVTFHRPVRASQHLEHTGLQSDRASCFWLCFDDWQNQPLRAQNSDSVSSHPAGLGTRSRY